MQEDRKKILIIDDDSEVRTMIADVLCDEGYHVEQADDLEAAKKVLQICNIDLIFLDLWIGENENRGIEILEFMKKKYPPIPVVMISGHGNIDIAVKAIKQGAYDFIEKPFVLERMLITTSRAIESATLSSENTSLRRKKPGSDVVLVGSTSYMTKLRNQAVKLAASSSSIYITSKPGGYADELAWLIHCNSSRKERRFVVFDCKRNDDSVVKQELFGSYVGGGLIRNLNGGSLFLDNITHLSQEVQYLLLNYLRSNRVNNTEVDTRIIANSYENESTAIIPELLNRLSIASIEIKPIKERVQDLECIIDYFYKNSFALFGISTPPKLTDSAKNELLLHKWPGNIRQLRNVVENLFLSVKCNEIKCEDLHSQIDVTGICDSQISDMFSVTLKEARDKFEKEYLMYHLKRFCGNVANVASFINMDRSALYKKLKTLGIEVDN